MQTNIKKIIQESITAQAVLLYDEKLISQINECAGIITRALKQGKKILIFGNGGSAADSQHFAAELIGRFQKERKALAAIALSADTSILTSLSNDYTFDVVFKRQIEALGRAGDIAFGISTSGKSKNVLVGIKEAKARGLKTMALTGKDGGSLARCADTAIIAPANVTARIQEIHILTIHILCEIIEESLKA